MQHTKLAIATLATALSAATDPAEALSTANLPPIAHRGVDPIKNEFIKELRPKPDRPALEPIVLEPAHENELARAVANKFDLLRVKALADGGDAAIEAQKKFSELSDGDIAKVLMQWPYYVQRRFYFGPIAAKDPLRAAKIVSRLQPYEAVIVLRSYPDKQDLPLKLIKAQLNAIDSELVAGIARYLPDWGNVER